MTREYLFDIWLCYTQNIDFSESEVDPYIEDQEQCGQLFFDLTERLWEVASLKESQRWGPLNATTVELSDEDDWYPSTKDQDYHYSEVEYSICVRYKAKKSEVELGPRRRTHFSLSQQTLERIQAEWTRHFNTVCADATFKTKNFKWNWDPDCPPIIKVSAGPARGLSKSRIPLRKTAPSYLECSDEAPCSALVYRS